MKNILNFAAKKVVISVVAKHPIETEQVITFCKVVTRKLQDAGFDLKVELAKNQEEF